MADIQDMNKTLTKHQQILQLKAWGWSLEEISESLSTPISVVSVITRSPLGLSVIESLRNNGS